MTIPSPRQGRRQRFESWAEYHRFEWSVGSWEWIFGVHFGFGIALMWMPGEFLFELGPLVVGGTSDV